MVSGFSSLSFARSLAMGLGVCILFLASIQSPVGAERDTGALFEDTLADAAEEVPEGTTALTRSFDGSDVAASVLEQLQVSKLIAQGVKSESQALDGEALSGRSAIAAQLVSSLREIAPGAMADTEKLRVSDLGPAVVATSGDVDPSLVVLTDHVNDAGEVVGQHIAMARSREAGPVDVGGSSVTVPTGKGFASSVRVSSNNYGWVYSSNGSIRLSWIKDKVVSTSSYKDWYVYTLYVRAVPAYHSLNQRFVGDIDVIGSVTNGSAWKIIEDRVTSAVTPHSSNSCSDAVTLNIGSVVGVGLTQQSCDKNYEKGDRFGGLHSEFRSYSFECRNTCNFWNQPDWNEVVEHGWQIEVSVYKYQEPYWNDYGDAYFISQWGPTSEPSSP